MQLGKGFGYGIGEQSDEEDDEKTFADLQKRKEEK